MGARAVLMARLCMFKMMHAGEKNGLVFGRFVW